MKNYSRRLALALFSAVFLFGGLALAGSAGSFLEGQQKALSALIAKPKSPANDKQVAQIFDGLLDYERLAKDSLGSSWAERTDAEKKEFQALLTKLVQAAYTKNIRSTLDYKIVIEGSKKAKEGELISTVARHKSDKRKEAIHINYLVHQIGGKWRVYDIITEGSSLVKNYKSQFRRIIRKKGFSELLTRMRKKAKAS